MAEGGYRQGGYRGGDRRQSGPGGGKPRESYGTRGRGGNRGGGGGRGGGAGPDGDSAVSELEQALKACTISQGKDSRSEGKIMLHLRPDNGGVEGRPIDVLTNCWDMKIAKCIVFMYDMEATKMFRFVDGKKKELNLPPKRIREHLYYVMREMPPCSVYDGGRIVFCSKELPGITREGEKKLVPIPGDDGHGECVLEYIIKLVSKVTTSELYDFVENTKRTTLDVPQDSIRFIDCIFKSIAKMDMVNIGRASNFYPEPVKQIAKGLYDIHKGVIASVRPQWKIRLNADLVFTAFFMPGNMADVLYEKYGDGMSYPNTWPQMERDVMKLRVTTSHNKNSEGKKFSRQFTVFGLSKEPANKLNIEDLNKSVAAYFEEAYNIRLKYPELPCVKVAKNKATFIPMELVDIIKWQPPSATKADLASEIVRCAAIKPQERYKELESYVRTMVNNQHELVKNYGLKIDPTRIEVKGRVLPTPWCTFGSQAETIGRGKWDAKSFHLPASTSTIDHAGSTDRAENAIKWAILAMPPDRFSQKNIDTVWKGLTDCAKQYRVHLHDDPPYKAIPQGELRNEMSRLRQGGIKLVVIVLNAGADYASIKRLGDLEFGIRTQCVKSSTIGKPRVWPNILLKINGKLGGINWKVPNMLKNNDRIMVIGADVTHPAVTSKTGSVRKSIAAVIGSITPDLMRHAVVIRQQDTNESGSKQTREIIDGMDKIMESLIEANMKEHGMQKPTRIIVYRDGVSEGQFLAVLISELAAIQKACDKFGPDYRPAITYITTQKRHHVRFFPKSGYSNVPPGTVVDSVVTNTREFDFYLCSQEGIQGTSKPAHYCVLYDDSNWTSDALQKFTFYLCHAYMRCSKSVSYPAPTYYSHLAAFRARAWQDSGDIQNLIKDNMYQIHNTQKQAMFFL